MLRRTVMLAALAACALSNVGAAEAAKPPKPPKPPSPAANQLTITAAPTRLLFGRTTVLSGKLTGPDHAGKVVSVEEDGYPFDTFKALAPTATTDANGDWRLTVQPALNTRYRAMAKTSPTTTSANILVQVVKRVSLTASDRSANRGQKITFSGKVSPAHDGQAVVFQRRSSSGSWVTLRSVVLQDDGAVRSRYTVSMRVRSTGVYRTVAKADADHGTGKSRALRVTVS